MMDDLVKILKQRLNDLNINLSKAEEDIIVTFVVVSKEIELICKLPNAFPYVFPKVLVSDKTLKQIGAIPHLNSDSSLCLFDAEKVVPNFTASVNLIEETLRKAYQIIKDGVLENNKQDFFDEFNAYWNKETKMTFYSNVTFKDKLLILKFYVGNNGCYISKDVDSCIRMAVSYGESPETHTVQDCIYIPLKESCYGDAMNTQRDFGCIIKRKSDYYKEYSNFLAQRNAKKNLVLFSQPNGSKFIVNGFLHSKIAPINGFRKGKVPLSLFLIGKDGTKKIEHINLIDVSQKRLFFRGGTGYTVFDKTFGIIGCGSLGSNLVEMLMNCGCSKFSFYDNQLLTEENIARHVCGFSDIKQAKTDALKNKLIHHNPNMIIETFKEDIHEVLNMEPETLNNHDYLILTVANTPIEYRMVQLFREKTLKKTIVIMWIEPYAMAGHALVMNKPQDIYSELFTEEFTFINSIVLNGEKLYKREVGCQSTFMPYSGLDVKAFAISFVKFLTSKDCESNKNYHFMWVGNINAAKDYGVELSQKAVELEEYHSYIERID